MSVSSLNAGTGTSTLTGGTFNLSASNVLADTSKVDVSGGTLAIGAFSDTVATVTLTSGSITGSDGTLTSTNTIQAKSGSASAILGGSNGLTKSTAGIVTLSAQHLHWHDHHHAGTLDLAGGTAIVDAGMLT